MWIAKGIVLSIWLFSFGWLFSIASPSTHFLLRSVAIARVFGIGTWIVGSAIPYSPIIYTTSEGMSQKNAGKEK
jgi:hypothetical protein